MAKKKKIPTADVAAAPHELEASPATDSSTSSSAVSSNLSNPHKKAASKTKDTPVSSLTISRNKHWRYISAFHGPWLQLPPEILETIAHSNYFSPRPRQSDSGVLYDLVKIRRLVDDAADLAVRAQNGTASSALSNGDNGLPGGSLGLSSRGSGGNAKLSPERKYRMRELATQKLAQAYRLDEVAASVATMQSASTLDNVAGLVLQRSPTNADAQYVHFFHEKIPSRMMAEYTPLAPLNEIIARTPGHVAPFRTRALTKIFKDDHVGAIQDLTEGLALCRREQAKYRSMRNQLVPTRLAREELEKRKIWTKDWMRENKVADADQPRGLEMQLLFQRGNQYLTVACQHIRTALEHFRMASMEQRKKKRVSDSLEGVVTSPVANEGFTTYQKGLEAREQARKNAKRALRDYTAFFAQLDYAHAPTNCAIEKSFGVQTFSGNVEDLAVGDQRLLLNDPLTSRDGKSSALVKPRQDLELNGHPPTQGHTLWQSSAPDLMIHDISALLSASPPPGLPPYPSSSSVLPTHGSLHHGRSMHSLAHDEMITYHPLMPETLHSLLLTHCLLQTPPKALLRHANNVARLARLADGYPFFLSARSPARADWAEILRKTKNWIGLSDTWDSLCKPPTPTDESRRQSTGDRRQNELVSKTSTKDEASEVAKADRKRHSETSDQKRDRIHKEAVIDALGDERVVDDDTFQRAVEAREKRAWREEAEDKHPPAGPDGAGKTSGRSSGEPIGRGAGTPVAKDEEYLIGTERADALAKWILEAPVVVEGKPKKGKKKPARAVAANLHGDREDLTLLECRAEALPV